MMPSPFSNGPSLVASSSGWVSWASALTQDSWQALAAAISAIQIPLVASLDTNSSAMSAAYSPSALIARLALALVLKVCWLVFILSSFG